MKLPVPMNGSRMWTSGIAERAVELGAQDVLHAGDHEIDERLRRVDDAVRVGHLDAEALEEPLVDGVEEPLLLGEVLDRVGGLFDGDVEVVELAEELVAAEGTEGQRLDDLLDLGGDDVALHEVADVEDLAEDALGEEVLDEHLLDGGVGEVRIERLTAEGEEVVEDGRRTSLLLFFSARSRSRSARQSPGPGP